MYLILQHFESFYFSDPYCRVSLCQDRSNPNDDTVTGMVAVSEQKKKTLNPVWDAEYKYCFTFNIFDYLSCRPTLRIPSSTNNNLISGSE